MKRALLTITVLISTILFAQAQDSSVPELINYQGKLTDVNGNPLEGQHKLEFNIWNQASLGTKLWGPQTFTGVQVIHGHFNVILGPEDVSERLIVDAFADSERYLEILIDDRIISPRQRILSAPYAIRSEHAESARSLSAGIKFNCWESNLINCTIPQGGPGEATTSKVDNSDVTITTTGGVVVIGLKPTTPPDTGTYSHFWAQYKRLTSRFYFDYPDDRANWHVVIGTVENGGLGQPLAQLVMPEMDPFNETTPTEWHWLDGRWVGGNAWPVEVVQKIRLPYCRVPIGSIQTTLLDLPAGTHQIAVFIKRENIRGLGVVPEVRIENCRLYAYEVGGQGH